MTTVEIMLAVVIGIQVLAIYCAGKDSGYIRQVVHTIRSEQHHEQQAREEKDIGVYKPF